jgi:hypothetical protein
MAVIQTTLELIRNRLNDALQAADTRRDDWVILSNIVDQNGQPFPNAQDKIVMCLASIQSEQIISADQRTSSAETARAEKQQFAVVAPPLYIDLYLLFYANFADRNYPQGLGLISRTISFFQQSPWFTRDNLPSLDPVIDKLTFEFFNLDLQTQSRLMESLGAKYLPSVCYKVRLIPFHGEFVL